MNQTYPMFSKSLLMAVLSLFLVWNTALAQETSVTGKVTNEQTNTGLSGANVTVSGTSKGTITDANGNFRINVKNGETLVISYQGFTPKTIVYKGAKTLNVSLSEEVVALDQVVVVGYGTQKKKELTGAVAQVKSEEMERIVASDFTKTLQGQVAGVNVVESSGRPGDQANIQIRGLGSISSDAQPLYVVDGIPYNGNPNLAAEEIATVDVLKDGASAAIYGTRASNGVILITTKRGKAGRTRVDFNSYYGIQNITSGTPLLSTPEHIYVDEMTQAAQGGVSNILFYNPNALDYNSDFVGAITNNNAGIQNYNLTLSGGKEGITFNVNTNYFKQDGILIQSGYDRFSTRANATLKKGRFDAFATLGIIHTNKKVEPWGLYEFAMFQGPYRKPLNELATTENSVVIGGINPDHVSYLSRLLKNDDRRKEDIYNIAANLKFEVMKGLYLQSNLGVNNYNYGRKFWQPQYLVYDANGDLNVIGSRQEAILSQDFNSSRKYTMENLVNYTKAFGKHNFNGVLGYTIEKTDNNRVSVEKRDFMSNSVQVFDGGNSLTGINGSDFTNSIIGKLARVQYSYDGRYMLSASIRNDASSNFGPDNRYAYFPGVSVGWNINEESFMSGVNNIKNLKLRASYGKVGNQGIPPYLYSAYVDNNINYVWGPETGDVLGNGAIQRGYGNPAVKWETNVSRNIGVDLVMYNGKFTFTADVYKNDKQDMLLSLLIPPSTGTSVPNDWANRYNSIVSNVGNMENKGIELSSSYNHRTSSGLNFSINANFTRNINTITSLGDLERVPLADSRPGNWRSAFQDVTTYMVPGYAAGSFFLIPTNGIFKTQKQLDDHVFTDANGVSKRIQPNAKLGDLIYQDTNNDGVINDLDRVFVGSGMPKFETGLIFNADYKGFDFNLQFYYSYGNKVYNGAKLFAYSMGRHKDLYYMWTPQNAESDVVAWRTSSEHDNFRTRSDYFLEDGSFLRIRNASLGYNISSRSLSKININKARVYVSAQNPYTFTKYEGYDPEVGGNGISNRGIDKAAYPVTRKFLMGVQIDF